MTNHLAEFSVTFSVEEVNVYKGNKTKLCYQYS